MVYIRSKKVKGDNYLYLVRSVWNPKEKTSKQEIVKYLGNATDVKTEDIPTEYRSDPKISSFLLSHAPTNLKKTQKLESQFQKRLHNFLRKGDVEGALQVYNDYHKSLGTTEFFENILKPVMYEVGSLWAKGKIDVATEHVCSNVANSLVNIIKQKNSIPAKKQKVLICTPVGEEHHLGCNVLESYLSCKGFKVFNMSPSAPAESVLTFMKEKNPDVVFVSITLEENLKNGQRLVNKIKEKFDLPIIVGGQAVKENKTKFDAIIFEERSIEKIPRIITTSYK